MQFPSRHFETHLGWRFPFLTIHSITTMPSLEDARALQALTGADVAADDLFYVFDASTNLAKSMTKAELQVVATAAIPADPADEAVFEGEPVSYVAEVAATAMSETYTVDTDKTVTLTAKTLGVLSPAPKLVITAASALPAGSNASLAIVSQAAGVVTVRPATGAGDAAAHVLLVGDGTGTKKITTTLTTAGTGGNAKALEVVLPTTTSPFGATIVLPNNTTADGVLVGDVYTVTLGTSDGTEGTLNLVEDAPAESGSITITTAAGYFGAWGNTHVKARVDFQSGVNLPLVTEWTITATDIELVIKLPTSSAGLTVAASDDDVQTAAAAALETAHNSVLNTTVDISAFLDVASDSLGNFVSSSAWVSMSGGVDPEALTSATNQATNVASVIDALAGTASSVVGAGAGSEVVAVTAVANFSGGGANSAITSTLADLTTLLHAAPSTIIDCTAGAGAQTSLLEATAGVTLTGGSNVVAAIIGTPAVNLGRRAIGFATGESTAKSVWTAMVADPTGTNAATWVKTHAGS